MACGFVVGKNSKVDLEIKGDVVFKGGINEDGIRVYEDSVLNIFGSGNLYCSGNNEKEYNKDCLISNKQYGNTDDKAYENTGGSGIGFALHKEGVGTINIIGLNNLVAKGYGKHAAGIGGGHDSVVTIKDTHIEYARGGYGTLRDPEDPTKLSDIPANDFIAERKTYVDANGETQIRIEYGKAEAEGGIAIGVGSQTVAGRLDYGTLNMENVTVEKAHGGSKSAAIGAMYWTKGTINIKDCDIKGVIGGNGGAAIGGSRYGTGADIEINIDNSTIDVEGGRFAAGIGSGYNCDTVPFVDTIETKINITGNSKIKAKGGINGAAVGTGYHNSKLVGKIDPSVELDLSLNEPFANIDYSNCTEEEKALITTGGLKYADNSWGTLSKPQTVGYGVLYTHLAGRECVDADGVNQLVLSFDNQGQTVDDPRAEENIMSRHPDYDAK